MYPTREQRTPSHYRRLLWLHRTEAASDLTLTSQAFRKEERFTKHLHLKCNVCDLHACFCLFPSRCEQCVSVISVFGPKTFFLIWSSLTKNVVKEKVRGRKSSVQCVRKHLQENLSLHFSVASLWKSHYAGFGQCWKNRIKLWHKNSSSSI